MRDNLEILFMTSVYIPMQYENLCAHNGIGLHDMPKDRFSAIGTIGLGIKSVYSENLVPKPPAKIIIYFTFQL